MKKIALVSMVCIWFVMCVNVYASDNDLALNIGEVQSEIETFISETQLPMDIENFSVSLREDVDLGEVTEKEIQDLLELDIENMKELLVSEYYVITEHPQSRLTNNGGGEYTAEVWAGVPAIGWCTVKQDFKASISSGKIKSISFLGDGYMSGISWGQYNHIRSWYEIYSDSTKVDIYIKGSINYLLNLVNANYTATFLEELEVSGSSLVRQW